jgi:hypothetical protein
MLQCSPFQASIPGSILILDLRPDGHTKCYRAGTRRIDLVTTARECADLVILER